MLLMGYSYLYKKDISNLFQIKNKKLYLKSSRAKPINIMVPFKINENVAKMAAMVLDGSLGKDFSSLMFSQKKDKNKVREFKVIIKNLFGLEMYLEEYNGALKASIGSKVLGVFLNKGLDIHKSDESARIPYWVSTSPKSLIIEYLRYAFAMEGSINEDIKSSEIKFHSVDLSYLKELKTILEKKFDINSRIYSYYIKNYGWKYYLYILGAENMKKFYDIGFALNTHQERLDRIISNIKCKAWEITLVSILSLRKKRFTISDVNRLFPYLKRRAIIMRIETLIEKEYVIKDRYIYRLNIHGLKTALHLKGKINISRLRTNPKENEKRVFDFIMKRDKSYRNDISRNLRIHPITIHDVLKRLIKNGKIKSVGSDRFQRKFYKINS